ncbi:MAG: lysostaphin resistance A-like protein [Parvularculaceae bacterium]
MMVAGTAAIFAIGAGVAAWGGVPLHRQLGDPARGIAIGVAATVPMAAALLWFMRAEAAAIRRFRNDQIEFLSGLGFRLTPFRVLLIGLVAGIGEEALFRGALQTLAAERLPLAAAIVAPNLLFGALHAKSWAYAVITALAGCWFGAAFVFAGSLWAPMVAHGLYDMVALEIARREIRRRR